MQPAPVAPAWLHPYAPGVDVEHYDMAITVPVKGAEIRAIATLTVHRAPTVDTLRLDLIGLMVDSVLVNGLARPSVRDSTTIRVPLLLRDGQRLHVRVHYHGAPGDGLIIRDDSIHGWSAFGDNWPNRARYWIPSVDHPSDKATVQWRVTAPATRSVIANGTRWSRQRAVPAAASSSEEWTTTAFTMAEPIPTYLMVIGVATMDETTLSTPACASGNRNRNRNRDRASRAMRAPQSSSRGACVPQSVWTFPAETPLMPNHFAEADRIVAFFSEQFAPYPYARLSHVQSATRFGGMENATAIFYSDDAFRKNAVGMSLIAHETAHQWFGDAVTPRRWADLWLSEGFATYLAALYTQQTRGDSAFHQELRQMRDVVLSAPIAATRAVVDSIGSNDPVTMLNANSYQKGGFVLHMLRTEIGDAAFFGALQEYQRKFRHGTATTADLRASFERHAGVSLEPFFAQWLHRPGYADLTISWTWQASTGSLVMQVVQGTRFPPYAMPLAFAVRDQDGRSRIVQSVITAVPSQQIRIALPGAKDVTGVEGDPNVAVMGRMVLLEARH